MLFGTILMLNLALEPAAGPIPCPMPWARWNRPRAGCFVRCPPADALGQGGTGRGPMPRGVGEFALPVEPAAGRLLCPMPSGRCPGQGGIGRGPVALPDALRPHSRGKAEPAAGRLPCPMPSGRCPGQGGTGRGPMPWGVGACPARGTGRKPVALPDALRPMPWARWNRPRADALGSRRLPCPWNRPRAGCFARCPPADALGKMEPAAGRCPGESALALPVEPAARRLLCPMPSGRCPGQGGIGRGPMPRGVGAYPARGTGRGPVALSDALRPMPWARWNRPRADAQGSRHLPCPWNRPRAGCFVRCPPADALGKVEPAAGRCPGESALALPVEPAASRLLCPMPSGRCPGQGGTGRGPMPWGVGACPARGTGRGPVALPDALRPMPWARWNRPRADAQGSRRLPCPWNRPRAGCFVRCPPADALGKVESAAGRCPGESAPTLPVEPAAGRLLCPMPSGRCPGQGGTGRGPMPRGVGSLPCPWNRPRAGCFVRCPPADALGKVEPAAGRCPGESALALPVEPAASRLLCPMPSGRCPGQGGTGRGPMPWGVERLPCPWNRPRAGCFARCPPADALGKMEPAAGRCPGESALALPVEPASAPVALSDALRPMPWARWNRPRADAQGSRRLPCPWNRPRAGCFVRCPPADALGKVEPAAGRCPGESALALPVEPAAGRLLCPMPSGRCPGQGGTGRGPMPRGVGACPARGTGRGPVALPDALRPMPWGVGHLPCPWNRPRAGCLARCPPADALGSQLPCPWNRPRTGCLARCPPADAQGKVEPAAGRCLGQGGARRKGNGQGCFTLPVQIPQDCGSFWALRPSLPCGKRVASVWAET